MKRKEIAIGLIFCLLIGFLPTNAWADGEGSLDLQNGSITITESGYTQGGTSGTECPDSYTITQSGEDSTSNTITIESGTVNMTISGLNVEATTGPAIWVKDGATLNLTLADGSTSRLKGAEGWSGISVDPGEYGQNGYEPGTQSTLIVKGAGTLYAYGGSASNTFGGGAGIGGDGYGTGSGFNANGGDFGVVEIQSGTIYAVGGGAANYDTGAGAGIGTGGVYGQGDYTVCWDYTGHITITGGTVYANGGADYNDCSAAAGIGSGSAGSQYGTSSSNLTISITAGNIIATGGVNAAAIGGGVNGDCGTISITGGEIDAYGGGESTSSAFGGAGIGGGDSAGGGSITIGGTADVFAQGGGAAAGIGGNGGYVGNIVIEGSADVTAVGGNPTDRTINDASDMRGGAGIGAGNNNNFDIGDEFSHLFLNSSGTVIAYGGMGAQAIGMGTNPPSDKSYKIEIGNNAETVWMFNYDQVQPAVYGVVADNTMNFSELSVLYHTIFWHNGTDETTSGTAYACTENQTVDGSTYSWSAENNTVSITEGTAEILSGSYNPDLHDACDNWAVIYREPEPVTVTPADITVYTGGESYEGVINDLEKGGKPGEASNGLPTPGYYITLPDSINEQLNIENNDEGASTSANDLSDNITFVYGEEGSQETWTLPLYYDDESGTSYVEDVTIGDATRDRYVYQIENKGSADPVRVAFQPLDTDGTIDESKNPILSDDFSLELTHLYQQYQIIVYNELLNSGAIQAVITDDNGETIATLPVVAGTGTLTVRGTTNGEVVVPVGDATDVETAVSNNTKTIDDVTGSTITAIADENVSYHINDSMVSVDPKNVSLLADEIVVGNNADEAKAILKNYMIQNGFSSEDDNYCYQYLDLIDNTNGNAWVTPTAEVDVYWKLPQGTNSSDYDFKIVHFNGLNRQYNADTEYLIGTAGYEVEEYTTGNELLKTVTIGGEEYLKFSMDTFSPFVLVWEEDDRNEPDTPVTPDVPDGEDTPDLNITDHYSYIVGYPEDYRTGAPTDDESLWPVKPQGNITRAEVATIFYRLLTDEARAENWTQDNSFTDVDKGDWFNTPVSTLSAMDIIGGYEDGSFQPNAPITRAEFAAIAVRFFEEDSVIYEEGTFNDVVGGEWFANAVQAAKEHGIIGGYPDGSFQPNKSISRAEACSIVNRTLDRIPDEDHLLPVDEMRNWPDNLEDAWYYADMQEATNGHEYEWLTDNGKTVEDWTGELPEIDWDEVERELCALHGVPYEE